MRKLATLAFSFAGGIFAAQYLLPLSWQLTACLLACGFGAIGMLQKEPYRLRMLLIAAGAAVALAWNWGCVTLIQKPAEALVDPETKRVVMVAQSYAASTRYGAKVTVLLQLQGSHEVRAVYYGSTELLRLRPGNKITADVRLGSASHIRDEDITAFTSKGVFLLAYARKGDVHISAGNEKSIRWWPTRVGHAMQDQIKELFSGDEAGFLSAILTGDKTSLSSGAFSDISEAGLSHILAVSGMHCGFLLLLITFLVGRQRRRLVAAIAIPLLLFFALLVGGTPSAVRACIMLTLLLIAPLFYREGDSVTSLSTALMLILMKNPFAAASISLQLSFAAVAGMLCLTPGLTRAMTRRRWGSNRMGRALCCSVAATLGALIFTIPLSAYYFNIIALVSPLSNILCLWAASLIFCLGLPAVLLSFLWMPLGWVIGFIPRVLICYFLETAHLLASIPYHAVYCSNPYMKYWLAFLYFLILILFLRKTSRTAWIASGLAAATLVTTVYAGAQRYTQGKLNITALDVGQGECILLSSRQEFALLDCGSGNSWYDAGEIAADALLSMGCRELHYLLLTHYDYDHVSGVEILISRIKVDQLIIPESAKKNETQEAILAFAAASDVPIRTIKEPSCFSLGGTELTVYPPLGSAKDNERGLTCLCTESSYDLLDTGDMNTATEKKLLKTYSFPDLECLIVGHHGSKYSTSQNFLRSLKPETAIISVGSNSYGQPSDVILKRLKREKCKIFRTDLNGDVHITVN